MASKLSITDIGVRITSLQNLLSLYPRPYSGHIACVSDLAEMRWARYQLSREKNDLDKSILHCTEAIFLPPVSRVGPSRRVIQLLFHLAYALLERSKKFEQPEGIKYSIGYLRYLRGLPLDSFDPSRDFVTTTLVRALSVQATSDGGGGTQNIEEMVALCRELIASTSSAGFPRDAFMHLSQAIYRKLIRGCVQWSDSVIECLRDAVKVCPPGSHLVLFALVGQLFTRFMETNSNDDCEEATALLDRILDPSQSGECPDSIRDQASQFAALFALVRSVIFQNPQYSEESLSRLRASLSSSFGQVDENIHLAVTKILAFREKERYRQFGLLESLEEANSYTSRVVDLSSSQSLEKYRDLLFESDDDRESYSTTKMGKKFSFSKNYCQLHLQRQNVTKIASVVLQNGIKQSPAVPTTYRISNSPSIMVD
jgi:hypothetical protein